MYQVIKQHTGGKALALDHIPDNFFTLKNIQEFLKREYPSLEPLDNSWSKYLQRTISDNLCNLINNWLQQKRFPLEQCTNKLFFIYKGTKNLLEGNSINEMRPISVTPVIFKLTERLILNRITTLTEEGTIKKLNLN